MQAIPQLASERHLSAALSMAAVRQRQIVRDLLRQGMSSHLLLFPKIQMQDYMARYAQGNKCSDGASGCECLCSD